MNFNFNITVPAGTPADNPVRQVLRLDKGLVYTFEILCAPGVNGEVYCYIEDPWGNKVFPRNPDGVYKLWGSAPIRGEYPACKYRLTGENMNLVFVGYSPNAQYDHVITVSFWIVRESDIPLLERIEETGDLGSILRKVFEGR